MRLSSLETLPQGLRPKLALAAWTRAALLDRRGDALRLAPALSTTYPALAPYLATYRNARSASERRFTVAWLLLHAEGASPWVRPDLGRQTALTEHDPLRDNWWCVEAGSFDAGQVATTAKSIFQPAERLEAAREVEAILRLDPAINFICEQAIAQAARNPRDPRAPEALHRAVRATRFACGDPATTRWSRRAFQALHRLYPKSAWAKKTKYWY